MSSVRVRHPALCTAHAPHSVRTSAVRILVVTNAYPAPERPSFGIYVARLVAALERGGPRGRRSRPRARSAAGGWRTLRKYARLAWRARAAARRQPARRRVGPLPRADRDDRAPRRARRRRAVRADRARHRRRQRRALAAHPRGDAQGRRASACAVFAVSDELGRAPRGGRRAARRPPARRQRRRRPRRVRATATREVAAAALGWDVGRAARALRRQPRARARTSRGCSRRSPQARAEWGGGSLALVGGGPEIERARGARAGARHRRRRALRRSGVPPHEVPRWMRACDVACLVSEREGFGLARDRGAGLRPPGRRRARRARRARP